VVSSHPRLPLEHLLHSHVLPSRLSWSWPPYASSCGPRAARSAPPAGSSRSPTTLSISPISISPSNSLTVHGSSCQSLHNHLVSSDLEGGEETLPGVSLWPCSRLSDRLQQRWRKDCRICPRNSASHEAHLLTLHGWQANQVVPPDEGLEQARRPLSAPQAIKLMSPTPDFSGAAFASITAGFPARPRFRSSPIVRSGSFPAPAAEVARGCVALECPAPWPQAVWPARPPVVASRSQHHKAKSAFRPDNPALSPQGVRCATNASPSYPKIPIST